MAATDLERLVVQLSADIKKYENALNRAQGVTSRRLASMQRQATTSSRAIEASFIATGAKIAGAFAGAATVRSAIKLSEAATRIDNSLKVAGLAGQELEDVFDGLSKAALANGAPIESLANLYGKAALAQRELGVSSGELLNFTNNVALALRVAGTDAQSASGALLQLGQALGSGRVYAEEFNSILEGAPTIARAVAAGLEEAGGSVSKLKQLIADGEVSSEAFFRAFEAGAPILRDQVANARFTIAQAMTNIETALINVAKEFNESTGASERFAEGINATARVIDGFDVAGFIEKIRSMRSELDGFLADLGNAQIFKDLNELLGVTDSEGNVINLDASEAKEETASLEKEVKTLQDRIALNTELGFDNTEAIARLNEVQAKLAEVRAAAANLPETIPGYQIGPNGLEPIGSGSLSGGPPSRNGPRRPSSVTPVSLGSYTPPPSRGGGSGGGRRSGGGGGGGGGANDLQREIEQIKERTAAIQAETAAMEGLNPLLDDYGFSLEAARAKSDLLTAAQRAGIAVTPELKAQIDTLATGYAAASAEAEKLAEQQENARRMAEDFRGVAQDALGGFISDLREGKSATEALSNALDRVTDRLLDLALNSVFDNLFGGFGGLFGGGGGGGGLLPGLFSKGGPVHAATGGRISGRGTGTSDSIPAMLSDGEYVVNAAATKKNLALLEAINSGKGLRLATGGLVGHRSSSSAGGGSGPVVKVNIVNNAPDTTVSKRERETAGGKTIDVLVDETVAKKINTPGSGTRSALQGQYSLKGGLSRR